MKKMLFVLLLLALIAIVFPSCERRCICTYHDSGAEELIYSAYTKKDCSTYEEDLKNLGMNVDCDYK